MCEELNEINYKFFEHVIICTKCNNDFYNNKCKKYKNIKNKIFRIFKRNNINKNVNEYIKQFERDIITYFENKKYKDI